MQTVLRRVLSIVGVVVFVGLLSATFTGCASTTTRESTGEYVDNSAITTKVKAALAKDPVVSAMRVYVDTFKGVVQLSGFVNSETERNKADEIARSVPGVKDVKNNLIVKAK